MITLIVFAIVFVAFQIHSGLDAYKRSSVKGIGGVFSSFKTELIILAVFLIPIIVGNMVFKPADLVSPWKKIEYGTKYDQARVSYSGYLELVRADSTNLDHAYHLITEAFKYREDYDLGRNTSMNIYGSVYKHFEKLSQSDDAHIRDIGFWGMGFYSILPSDISQMSPELLKVKDQQLKYLNYALGLAYAELGSFDKATEHLYKEIDNNGAVQQSYELLSKLYYFSDDYERANEVLYGVETRSAVPLWIAMELSFLNADLSGYAQLIWKRNTDNLNWYGIFASSMITIIWLIFLMKLDAFRRQRLVPALGCFLLGILFSNGVYFIGDFTYLFMGLERDGTTWGDFMYCVAGIGAIEELVKLLPWVLVLFIVPGKKEPFTYLFFAAASALGFAFAENIFYFNDGGLDNIHARALLSVTSHMFDATLVAYFVILFKFKWKRNVILGGLIGWGLAALAHGIYDYWLIHEFEDDTWLLTVLFFLVTIHFWFTMMNNAINNSSAFNEAKRMDNEGLGRFLAVSLSALFMLEYLILGINYGLDYANTSLWQELFAGGYLIFYMASNLSGLDLVKGYWAPINFPLSSFIASSRIPRNYVGYRVRISAVAGNKPFDKYLPLEGEIIQRVVIKSKPNWFVVKLEEELRYLHFHKDRVIVFFPEEYESLSMSDHRLTHVYLIQSSVAEVGDRLEKRKIKLAGIARTVRLQDEVEGS